MKSYNHIFERIISKENIEKAILRSSLGKRDRKDVKYCLENIDTVSNYIQYLLLTNRFVPPHHELKEINDGVRQKKRKIVCPAYRYEQIIHHAIVQVIAPIFEKSLYPYSCASIPGRGVHLAKKYIEKNIRKHPDKVKYVLKMDIYHFFPTIDHATLKKMLSEKFHDERFLKLMDVILGNYTDWKNRGLPIGFYTSQWLANWYLVDLDYYIKQELEAFVYVRYNDDIVILGNNKHVLHGMRRKIEAYLAHDKKLMVNNKWQVFPLDKRALDFAGYRFHKDGHTSLRRTIMLRATRKAKKMDHVTWYNASQMLCYLAWLKSCDTYGIYCNWVKPYVSKKTLRRCISNHSRRINNEHESELAFVSLARAS